MTSGLSFSVAGLVAIAMVASIPAHGYAGHPEAPPAPAPAPTAPLRQCRPYHLSAEPTVFHRGTPAHSFRVFVEDDCGTPNSPVTVEVWYRALYYNTRRQPAFGAPYLVVALRTTTGHAIGTDTGQHLKYFEILAGGSPLHLGCYVARVRIAPSAANSSLEQAGDVEACALPPKPSLPGPAP